MFKVAILMMLESTLASAAKRPGFVKVGTTFRPSLERVTGKHWCVPKPTIHSYNSVYGNDMNNFNPSNILNDDDCDNYKDYWIASDNQNDVWLIIDFGCVVVFDQVTLRNTADWVLDWRGTKDFIIETSMDLGSWISVLEGTLQDIKTIDDTCARRIDEVFDLETPGYGRYLRFTARTHYYPSAGLNYIRWNYLI